MVFLSPFAGAGVTVANRMSLRPCTARPRVEGMNHHEAVREYKGRRLNTYERNLFSHAGQRDGNIFLRVSQAGRFRGAFSD